MLAFRNRNKGKVEMSLGWRKMGPIGEWHKKIPYKEYKKKSTWNLDKVIKWSSSSSSFPFFFFCQFFCTSSHVVHESNNSEGWISEGQAHPNLVLTLNNALNDVQVNFMVLCFGMDTDLRRKLRSSFSMLFTANSGIVIIEWFLFKACKSLNEYWICFLDWQDKILI